jgi:hypothetical protein
VPSRISPPIAASASPRRNLAARGQVASSHYLRRMSQRRPAVHPRLVQHGAAHECQARSAHYQQPPIESTG